MFDVIAAHVLAAVLAIPTVEPAPSASPAPVPQASATPIPVMSWSGVLRGMETFSSHANAVGNLANAGGTDQPSRFNISDALVTMSRNTGYFRYGASAGIYSIPVVGLSGNNTFQPGANVNTYGPLPSAYVSLNPNDRVSISAGYLATIIGQESTYTYLNANIQRGLVWNMETAVSRGARLSLTGTKFSGALEIDDGFFSGHYLGLEGSITNTLDANHSLQFVFVIPNAQAPPNWTAAIANKRLYNFMYTATSGRWTFQPYLLLADSPKTGALGYSSDESAWGAVFLSTWKLDPNWSLATRIEDLADGSRASDASANADLVGYGPGSSAWTITLTPTYQKNAFMARADLSEVVVRGAGVGLAFGSLGTQRDQFRVVLESGVQF